MSREWAERRDDADLTIAQRLASRISDFQYRRVTPRALTAARTALVDTIGVTLAGSIEPCSRLLRETLGVSDANGPCLVLGTRQRVGALEAALLNGTASHALDYDDFSKPFGGHQSVPLWAPLWAIAETHECSGKDLIAAYVIGLETEIRIARGVNFYHYDKGWHPTATLGIFGTVASVSHLLGLDEQHTAMALAIATSMAAGLKANFGTMVKPLHVGQCCRNGLLAVMLAEHEYGANLAAFEHKQGFLQVFNGEGNYDAERIFENWGATLEIENPEMGLKQFPCCGSTHPAISMALSLVHQYGVQAGNIASILIRPHPRRLAHTNNPHPQTPLNAKFSVQYAVSRALLDGAVRLEHFEGDAYKDPRVLRLLEMTRVEPHPDMPVDSSKQFGAEVSVTMHDGRVFTRRVDDLVGRGIENPMSDDEIWEKFSDCGRRVLEAERVKQLYERLMRVETLGNVGGLARLMVPSEHP